VEPSCFRKLTTDPHILAHVNIVPSEDRYPKLNIYISEMVLDSCSYIPVIHVTMLSKVSK
jgi:hypothetical protein